MMTEPSAHAGHAQMTMLAVLIWMHTSEAAWAQGRASVFRTTHLARLHDHDACVIRDHVQMVRHL